ncbi:HIT-like domain-containing protein [Tirmania nivea]|nr:HIT-like domain-containing protein [Tirmania nivea]
MTNSPIYFGRFVVTPQVFYKTLHSFAIVNLKPLLPGHVLVCSNRVVPRIKDLSEVEVTDLFLTTQKVCKVVEAVYDAQSFNIAIQDGAAAGQSVPHVHTHIIPRRFKDLPNSDDIYALIESEAGDLGKLLPESQVPDGERAKFPTPLPDELRKPRTVDDMEKEAKMLAKFMTEYDRCSKL